MSNDTRPAHAAIVEAARNTWPTIPDGRLKAALRLVDAAYRLVLDDLDTSTALDALDVIDGRA